ncbi:MAG: hypothetical protein AAF311_16430, partial [Pseudomonadota bacterium]
MSNLFPVRTDWTECVAGGLAPDPTALRAHLRRVHSDHAGFTERCARMCRDAEGRTSYEWLAETGAETFPSPPGGLTAAVPDP